MQCRNIFYIKNGLMTDLSVSVCRAVSISFNRMRVDGKSLRVRRLDDGNTVWIWYCTLSRKWIKYGDKVDIIKRLDLVQKKVPSLTFGLLGQFDNEYFFSGQDSKGHTSPVKSSDIENKFQSNPTSSVTFNVGAKTSEIKFRGEVYSKNFHQMHMFTNPVQLNPNVEHCAIGKYTPHENSGSCAHMNSKSCDNEVRNIPIRI